VTTGSIDPTHLRPAANTTLHRFVDHAELLPTTSLVVAHGGHATAVRSLAHGVPLLVMPMNPLMDQPLVGRAVMDQGVGLSISKGSSTRAIREATHRLLDDAATRDRARELGRSIREHDGAVTAADLIADFAAARASTQGARPVGA